MIGRKFNDKDVQNDMKHFPFKVINKGGQPRVSVDVAGSEKTFTPEEVSAMILTKMKEVAESYLGEKVNNARRQNRFILLQVNNRTSEISWSVV